MKSPLLILTLIPIYLCCGCATTVKYSQTGPNIAGEWRARNSRCPDNRNGASSQTEYIEIVRKVIDLFRPIYPEVFAELDQWIKEQNEKRRAFVASHPRQTVRPEFGLGDYHARVGMPKEILQIFYCEPNRVRKTPKHIDSDEAWEYYYPSSRFIYFIKDGKIVSIKILILEGL